MSKLLLVQPPVEDFYDTEVRLQPIGLAYLKAALLRDLPSVNVKIIDFHHGWGRRTVSLPPELRQMRRFFPWPDRSPLKTFHDYYRFGAADRVIKETFREESPDFVGISSLFSAYHREALAVASIAKRVTGAVTILGGGHVTAEPLRVLSSRDVDFVVLGEGELALVRLLSFLQSGEPVASGAWSSIPGLGYKRNGIPVLPVERENYTIDDLPIPDLSDFPVGSYAVRGRPLAQLVSSRGCPHECSFCSVHSVFGRGYRARSIDSVLEEIEARFTSGFRVIDFEDDNLTCRMERMKELCRRLIDRFQEAGPELVAMNGISYLSLDRELMELMKTAGFSQLNLSLVSSDRSVLRSSHRPHLPDRLEEVVRAGFELGFDMTCYQILGLPDESLESMIETLGLLARLPVRLGASPFYLAPGSALAKGMEFSDSDLVRCRLTAMGGETPPATRAEIFTLFVLCRVINFLKALPLASGASLPLVEALAAVEAADASRDGARVLRRLLDDGAYVALTRGREEVVEAFSTLLFRRAWPAFREIVTLRGACITLP